MLSDEDAHQTKAADEHIRMLNFMEVTINPEVFRMFFLES